MAETRGNTLHFDPDCHPDNTLKALDEFIQDFQLRYDANHPDPPKVSLDSAIQRWMLGQTDSDKKPNLLEYDQIVDEWKSRDKVAKFLGLYSSRRMYNDWCSAIQDEKTRKDAKWEDFTDAMRKFYKPTENLTLKNFQFRSLVQEKNEAFIAFCNRVEREAKHCQFNCESAGCTAEATSVRDQIVIGMISEQIREEALKSSWSLVELRKEGMRMESATKSANEIAGEAINKVGKYSFRNTKNKSSAPVKKLNCYFCGAAFERQDISSHSKQCPARSASCSKCKKTGHYAKVCKGDAQLKEISVETSDDDDKSVYNVNIFRIKACRRYDMDDEDFKVKLIINNSMDTVLADTGAKVAVCSKKQAEKWNLLERMVPSHVKIKPYKSTSIPTIGESRCAVTFGERSIPVVWHIIKEDCEPIISGGHAKQLGIIRFASSPDPLMPVNMIKMEKKDGIQKTLSDYAGCFQGIGKLRDHEVKLQVDESIKPVAEPPRRIPYHLRERVDEALKGMLENDVIEEQPNNVPTTWLSNLVIAPKDDGDIRITLDAKNLNKALQASNFPIPRQEDIKAKLAGCKVFSKLDLKTAFWQLEIAPESRKFTAFHASGKLYRYKRLVMGLKSAQGELNNALQPLFSAIPGAHIIHDDLIIATVTEEQHEEVLKRVMEVISAAGLTLNPKKCVFGGDEIHFWGLIVSGEGVRPDPEKIEALNHLTRPKTKDELLSFVCMMQSNAEFIPNFSVKAAKLREMTKKESKFRWGQEQQKCYEDLIVAFRNSALLQYFDGSQPTFIFVDAHQSGLGAILAQGETVDRARPVAMASRCTSQAEKHYPQLDLEATSIDFGLRRFRDYLVGSPHTIKVITDHKPLTTIFNGRRKGSIRTQRVKLRHQDIPYTVQYQKGAQNIADYMSRHAKPFSSLTQEVKKESEEFNNLLYTLHTTPVTDCIGLSVIATETDKDPVLRTVRDYVKQGKSWIPKTEDPDVQKFKGVMSELTVTGNGILFKDDRIVLPASLHKKAIELAHRGAHPGQSGMERRLRYHFFFHGMFEKVKNSLRSCNECALFMDKKTKEPITHHKIPDKCWETVSVDLYGPMPSSKHVVVVHDLASRYPAAKLVASTKADKVLPILSEIYDDLGNPVTQISDNGPPFNSKKMAQFAAERDINLRFTPPYHPNANPAETCMKTVGKAMKFSNFLGVSDKQSLNKALTGYRQTPHPATGIPPANRVFRDGVRAAFPRKSVNAKDIKIAMARDLTQKTDNEEKVNSSKYRKLSNLKIGDHVFVRNVNKTSKFDPVFRPDPFQIMAIDEVAKKLILRAVNGDQTICRHPDDVKLRLVDEVDMSGEDDEGDDWTNSAMNAESVKVEQPSSIKPAEDIVTEEASDESYTQLEDDEPLEDEGFDPTVQGEATSVRRSTRVKRPNPRYVNSDFAAN